MDFFDSYTKFLDYQNRLLSWELRVMREKRKGITTLDSYISSKPKEKKEWKLESIKI